MFPSYFTVKTKTNKTLRRQKNTRPVAWASWSPPTDHGVRMAGLVSTPPLIWLRTSERLWNRKTPPESLHSDHGSGLKACGEGAEPLINRGRPGLHSGAPVSSRGWSNHSCKLHSTGVYKLDKCINCFSSVDAGLRNWPSLSQWQRKMILST